MGVYNDASYEAAMVALSGVMTAYGIFVAILGIITIIGMWKLFVKAGKPGWASIIPFYNMYCLSELAFGNGWLFLLACVPCVNIVYAIMLPFKLAKAFGKGVGFGFGLLFLSTIFYCILGFGSAEYIGVQK